MLLVAALESEGTGVRTVKLATCSESFDDSNRSSVSWNRLFTLDIGISQLEIISAYAAQLNFLWKYWTRIS
jgi:hypothetical protein